MGSHRKRSRAASDQFGHPPNHDGAAVSASGEQHHDGHSRRFVRFVRHERRRRVSPGCRPGYFCDRSPDLHSGNAGRLSRSRDGCAWRAIFRRGRNPTEPGISSPRRSGRANRIDLGGCGNRQRELRRVLATGGGDQRHHTPSYAAQRPSREGIHRCDHFSSYRRGRSADTGHGYRSGDDQRSNHGCRFHRIHRVRHHCQWIEHFVARSGLSLRPSPKSTEMEQ